MGLTTKAVEAAKPDTARREIPDGRGLYLLVQPSGAKSWAVRCRLRGRATKLTLGTWPAMTLAAARKAAADARLQVAEGGDPTAAKREARAAVQLAQKDSLRSVC